MYKNEKGEEIDFRTYTRAKFKQLMGEKDEGTKVLKALVNDKNLTEEERQKVCFALAKAGTQYECDKAKGDPTTLMRSDSGFTYFNAAYLKEYAKDYLNGVTEKQKGAIQNLALGEQEMHQEMVNAYSSELPKMSKQAALFLKMNSDVVKGTFPEHADRLTARMLVNNLNLRTTSPALTIWSVSLEGSLEKDVKERFKQVKENIKNVSNRVGDLEGAIGIQEDRNKKLKQDVQDLEGQPFEQRLAQQKLDDGIKALDKLKEDHSKAVKNAPSEIEKVTKEGQKILGKDSEKVQPIQRGYTANVAVLRALNHTDGFALDEVGEGELNINSYKAALGKIASGKVPGQEINGGIEVEAIDVPGIVKEVNEENQVAKLKRDENERLRKEQAVKEKVEASTGAYANAQLKAKPELEKIAAMEKELDSLNLAKKQLKTPGATLEVNGQKVETYKPGVGDKIKAAFTKGGLEAVLDKKRESLMDKIDKEKMTVQLKTDKNFHQEVMDSHHATGVKMGEQAAALKTNVERYEVARQQVMDAERDLIVNARLKESGLPSLPPNKVEELEARKLEGELAMTRYEGDYHEHAFLSEQQQTAQTSHSVRDSLKKGVEQQEKLAESQKLKEDNGTKVREQVKVTEKVEAPKQKLGVK